MLNNLADVLFLKNTLPLSGQAGSSLNNFWPLTLPGPPYTLQMGPQPPSSLVQAPPDSIHPAVTHIPPNLSLWPPLLTSVSRMGTDSSKILLGNEGIRLLILVKELKQGFLSVSGLNTPEGKYLRTATGHCQEALSFQHHSSYEHKHSAPLLLLGRNIHSVLL